MTNTISITVLILPELDFEKTKDMFVLQGVCRMNVFNILPEISTADLFVKRRTFQSVVSVTLAML